MGARSLSTSHLAIVKYWYGKSIKPNGDIIEGVSADAIPVVCDIGEPSCWGCDKLIIGDAEKHRSDEDDEIYVKKVWSDPKVKSKFERCHIVPHAMGGGDEPSNLFLMCPSCHFASPDTLNPKSFFRWVYDQRSKFSGGKMRPQYALKELNKELNRRGLPSIEELFSSVEVELTGDASALKEYLKKHIGAHCRSYVDSSITCGTADWIINQYVSAVLK